MLEAKDAAAQSKINKEILFEQHKKYLLGTCEHQISEAIKFGNTNCMVDCYFINTDIPAIKHIQDYLSKMGYKTKYYSGPQSVHPYSLQIEW